MLPVCGNPPACGPIYGCHNGEASCTAYCHIPGGNPIYDVTCGAQCITSASCSNPHCSEPIYGAPGQGQCNGYAPVNPDGQSQNHCSACKRLIDYRSCTVNGNIENDPDCSSNDDSSCYGVGDCIGGGGGTPTPPPGGPTPTPTPTPTPAPGPWWQVKDSDVQSAGDLLSNVPTGSYFGTLGTGGYPGVPAYGGSTGLTGANVSSVGWLVNSSVTNPKTYNYDYFANQIPDEITAVMNSINPADVAASLTSGGTPDANGYYWYKYDGATNGALSIPAVDFGTRKIILMVDNADLNITGNIDLTVGQGLFVVIVKGNISVDPGVGGGGNHNLAGLYFADGTFSDGVGSSQLWVRGSVVANGGISMQRDLGLADDMTTPSELFVYAPDQILLFPKVFGARRISWKEVAP